MGIRWKGVDGTLYEFSEHPYTSDWAEVAGIFIFAARFAGGNWNPLYICAAENLRERIRNDEKWPWAVRLGATDVLACAVGEPERRARVVAEMIKRLKPPLNDFPQGGARAASPLRQAGDR